MDTNGILNKLKKILDDIYSDFRSRIDADAWKNAIAGSYRENPEKTAVVVTDFMLSHRYVPAKVWRTVFYAIELREQPVKLSNIYSRATVNDILDRMSGTDALRYGYIPANVSEETIRYLMDTAQEAGYRLQRGQIYLAEKAIEGIRSYCPTHPDLLDLQKQYAEVRSTGGVPAQEADAGENRRDRKTYEELMTLSDPEQIREAAEQLEKLIGEDYHVYDAYYPLGILYLKQGEVRKADWIANLLMDLGESVAKACILKGKILEEENRPEDAYFYYERASLKEPSSKIAAEECQRLMKLLEPDCRGAFWYKEEKSGCSTLSEELPEVRKIAADTEQLIRRGRLTEAYFELAKKSEEYRQSDLLRFKKALALYLMKKEPEARAEFRAVSRDSALYQHAEYLVYDLDCRIVDHRQYENILPQMLADIFFNTGNYAEALSVYNKIDEPDMSAAMWVQKGRCELETGKLKGAQHSFANAMNRDYHVEQARELTGLLLQNAGEHEQALEMFDEAIRLFPDRKNIWEFKASLLYAMERNEELLEFRNQLENRKMQPSDVDGYAGLVQVLGYPRNEERGLHCLERAMASGTTDAEVYIAAANVCILREQYFRAMLYIEHGLRATKNAEELYMKKSEILYLSKDLESAFINAGILLTKNPESAEIQYLMGCITTDRGNDKEGIRWFRSAAELDPGCHKYAYAVADKCFETGDMNGALKYYTKAIELDAEDSVSLKRRALICSLRDEKQKAVDDIQRAVELQPDDPEVYLILGDILSSGTLRRDLDLEAGPLEKNQAEEEPSEKEAPQREDDSEEEAESPLEPEESSGEEKKDAEYYYSKAIAMNPSGRQGYISRARYYTDVRRLDDALLDIQKAVELDPEAGDSYMMRGLVHHVRGENKEAAEDFERAARSEHLALQACSYLAKCHNAMQQYEEAIEAADRGLAMDGEFLNLYVNRGVALFHLERYYQAIEDFKRVIQKKNEVNTAAVEAAYRFRGMTNELLGNTKAALADYRMLMKYNPDYQDIRQKITEMEGLLEQTEKKHHFSFFRKKKRRED